MRFLVLLLGLCLVSTSHAGRSPASKKCRSFCQEIHACADQVDQRRLGNLLCEIARCETGDKCKQQIRSPNGLYHGPFQFSASTWKKVCHPLFKKKRIQGCSGKGASSQTCCATMCAAEMVASNLNGGIKNWPTCGKRAERELSSRE